VGIFSNIVSVFTIFVITFYLLMERKNLDSLLLYLFGEQKALNAINIINKVEERLGAWVRGQLTLILIIGTMTYVGLTLLGVPYALPLAIFAGILEVIPNIGPIVSAIPAIIVAISVSPWHIVFVIILYFVVQQLENQLIVPIVIRKSVGLPPLITIVSLLIGFRLAGVIGGILAIPIVVTIETVVSQYLLLRSDTS
jgi:predicted PurR-regulated permease PerM